MINRVVLVGRLTRDPELKKTNSGSSICSFTVAVDNRQKNAEGEKTASYINCVTFQQSADNMFKYTRKGSLVGVDGRLNQRSYQRQDGSKASIVEVLADSVQFLEPKSATNDNISDSSDESSVFAPDAPSSASESNNTESLDLADDDVPWN